MLKFFRRIRRSLIESKSLGKYLMYAVGEIALVVIGILIALQINNWNERNKIRQEEKQMLSEIRAEMEYNYQRLASWKERIGRDIHCIESILNSIENKLPYQDSLADCFYVLTRSFRFDLSMTAFKTLESKGVDLISDRELKYTLLNLHADDYGRFVDRIENLKSNVRDYGRPIIRKNLKQVGNEKSVPQFQYVPLNYDELISDVELWNTLMTLGANYKEFLRAIYQTQDKLNMTIDMIEKDIKGASGQDR